MLQDLASERSLDDGALQIALRLHYLGLGRCNISLGFGHLRLAQHHGTRFTRPAQGLPIFQCLLGACLLLRQRGLGLRHCRMGDHHGGLVVHRVQLQ